MERKKLKLLVCALAVGLIAGLANADIETGLVGYWKLDDGSGTTAIDSSGSGNDGTLTAGSVAGLPEWKTAGGDVQIGDGSLAFEDGNGNNGEGNYVDCGTDSVFDITENITFALWVKIDAFTVKYQYVFSKGVNYMILRAGDTPYFRVVFNGLDKGDGDDYYAGGTTIPIDDGQWHHIAASYDSSTGIIAFYTDGILEESKTTFGSIPTNSESLCIGMRPARTGTDAIIDDVRLYDRTLDADDIMELYLYRGNVATNIAPTNGAELVAIDTNLSWGPPPTFTPTKYDLRYKVGDPNFATGTVTEVFNILRTDPCNVHNPDVDFAYNTTYYWRVDSYAPNYPSDPCIGGVWSFTTAPAEPVVTKDPVSLMVAIGGTAVFTVEDIGGTSYLWKRQSDNETVGGNSSTLTLTDVQTDPCDDSYYCIVSNTSGSAPPSAAATLWTKRLVARWEFEGNLLDSEVDGWDGDYVDPNTANPDPDPVFVSGGLDGQALSLVADALHVQITGSEDYFNFYPLGYTVNVWVKTEVPGIWGAIASKQHRGDWPDFIGWVLSCNNVDKASIALRQVFGANTGSAIVGTSDIVDNQWHMITGTYDAETGTGSIYVDGLLENQLVDTERKAPTNDQPVVIGAETALGEFSHDGLLDKMSIYSYAISPTEVALLYTDVMTGEEICIEYPSHDLNEDCRVDIQDFAMFAAKWLECNLVPECIN